MELEGDPGAIREPRHTSRYEMTDMVCLVSAGEHHGDSGGRSCDGPLRDQGRAS